MVRWSLVFVLVMSVSNIRAEKSSTHSVGSAMAVAAENFLASLNPDERAKATMKFDDPDRLDWHNIPKPARKGLKVGDMSVEQRKLCHELLKVSLSEVGYDKAVKIMALENNLREGEKGQIGTPLRDPDRYFLTIFGTPSDEGLWGWSFEGHHFSLNFVVKEGEVISSTPSFWGCNPATVHLFIEGGPEKGTRTLAKEEQLAFDLVNSLNESQRQRALIAAKAPADYRDPGKPKLDAGSPQGLIAADMTPEQKKTLWELLEAYSNNLAEPVAKAQLDDVKSHKLDNVYFAWAGSTKPGVGHYYRVQGPSFSLELVNIQSDPAGDPANHIHSVWRSLTHDFGVSAN